MKNFGTRLRELVYDEEAVQRLQGCLIALDMRFDLDRVILGKDLEELAESAFKNKDIVGLISVFFIIMDELLEGETA